VTGVGSSSRGREFERKVGELVMSLFGDEVVVLETDSASESCPVDSGFEGDDVADFEGVVPSRVDSRNLVSVEPDSVPCVMNELVAIPPVEFGMDLLIHCAAGLTRAQQGFSLAHDFEDPGMGLLLFVGGHSVDGKGSAEIASIAANSDPDIENVEFPGLDLATRSRKSTRDTALEILSPSGEEFAGREGRLFQHGGHELHFLETGFDGLQGKFVGPVRALDAVLESANFIGLLLSSEILVVFGDVATGNVFEQGCRGLLAGADRSKWLESWVQNLGDAGAEIRFQGEEMVGGVDRNPIDRSPGFDLRMGHHRRFSFASDENGDRGQWLLVPVTRERVDIVSVEKDGSIEPGFFQVAAEPLLAGSAGG